MGNQIQIFQNKEFGQIRTMQIDGQPWFVAKDVCELLGIVNHKDAVSRLDADEKGVDSAYPLDKPKRGGGLQKNLIVNESGLYTLIFQSRKPFAKAFRKWVTNEVLPTIRKTGCYKVSYPYEKRIKKLESLREIDRQRLEILQKWIMNIESERDIYLKQANACAGVISTKDFSVSENMIQCGKFLSVIRSDRHLPLSALADGELSRSELLNIEQGKEDPALSVFFRLLSIMGYSIQFVKNESLENYG